jgi:peptidylprolyl isomerase
MKKILLTLLILIGTSNFSQAQTIVTFYTNQGSFEVELYDTIVPITTQNFKDLVNSEYYDGVIFHRIISNFMIQGGDPTGTGSGGPGYTIPDEFDSSLSNINKTISMANSGPNTGGSQFFINTKNNTYLDFDKAPFTSKHPVFGIVISGWDTVEIIENVATNSADRPLIDVVMDSVRVTQIPLAIGALNSQAFVAKVFPNPVNNESVLNFELSNTEKAEIQLIGLDGKVLFWTQETWGKGTVNWELSNIPLNALPNGIYILTVKSASGIYQIKITK